MASALRKRKFRQQSENLAFGSGALRGASSNLTGFSKPGTTNIKIGTLNIPVKARKLTKLGKFGIAAAIGTSVAASIQNFRGSTGVGDFLGRELIGNPLRNLGGSLVAGGIAKQAINPLAKKGVSFVRKKRTGVDFVGKTPKGDDIINVKARRVRTPGDITFRRIGGRVVPIRRKK